MARVTLDLIENVSTRAGGAAKAFGGFVISMNQGLDLLERVGGAAFSAMDGAFEVAGRSTQLRPALTAMSGGAAEADANLQAVTSALRGTVSEMDAMEIANTALSFGLAKSSEDLGELAEIGAVLSQSLGKDARAGVGEFTEAIAKSSFEVLNNFGIILKQNEAYEEYAKRLDKTTAQLTEQEKAVAFQVIAMERARAKVEELGGFVETAATDWDRFKVNLDNARESAALALVDGLGPLTEKLAEFTADESAVGDAVRNLVGNVTDFAEAASSANQAWDAYIDSFDGSVLEGIATFITPLQEITTIMRLTLDLQGEKREASAANAQADQAQAALIQEINRALGENFTSFEEATGAMRENRAEVKAHREAFASGGVALQEYNGWLDEQTNAEADAAAATVEAKAVMTASMKLLGLSTKDTIEGQKQAEADWLKSYELIAESGRFTAEQLTEIWKKHHQELKGQFDATTIEIIGSSTETIHDLAEAFGPELFTGEEAAFATWVDREKNELLARQEEIMGPIGDAVSGGVDGGLLDADFESFGESLGGTVRRNLLDVMGDQELVGKIAEAFGIFTGQGIGDTGVGGGLTKSDLSRRDQTKLEGLLEDGQFDAIVAQGTKGAMKALESGDFLALKRIHDGALDNARNANQFGNKVRNKGFIDSNNQLANFVESLAKLFDLDIPGFAVGGIFDFGKESLARLHGKEAVVPLEEGGSRVSDAILGRGATGALQSTAGSTASLVDLTEALLRMNGRMLHALQSMDARQRGQGGAVAAERAQNEADKLAALTDPATALLSGTSLEVAGAV